MVTRDRIRLTGLLRKKPWKRGFFYCVVSRGTRRGFGQQPSAVSLEPLGAGARRSPCGLSASLRPAASNVTSLRRGGPTREPKTGIGEEAVRVARSRWDRPPTGSPARRAERDGRRLLRGFPARDQR